MYQKTKIYMARSRRVQYKNIMYFCKLHATSGAPPDASNGGSRIFEGGPFLAYESFEGQGKAQSSPQQNRCFNESNYNNFQIEGVMPAWPPPQLKGALPPSPTPPKFTPGFMPHMRIYNI